MVEGGGKLISEKGRREGGRQVVCLLLDAGNSACLCRREERKREKERDQERERERGRKSDAESQRKRNAVFFF